MTVKLPFAQIEESKVREIHAATDLSGYSHEELQKADAWIKAFAVQKLREKLPQGPTRNYVLIMVRAHYGSIETDTYLHAMQCYPDWLT